MTPEQAQAVELLRNCDFSPETGLPEELFLLVSSLVPLANVDLLIVNQKNQLLLSWRSDGYTEDGWHIPGGCLRYGERFQDRIRETARAELGCDVIAEERPLAVRTTIRGAASNLAHPRERGHHVSILFRCQLPEDYMPDNRGRSERDPGYLRWFDRLPPDFLKIQHVYDDILQPWIGELTNDAELEIGGRSTQQDQGTGHRLLP